MSGTTIAIVNALCDLSQHEELRVTLTETTKGALTVGTFAFIGGLVGGPIGLGVGGVIGAVTGAVYGSGKYKPVPQVIMHEMTPQQREQLALSFVQAFRNIGANDVMVILSIIMDNHSVKALALDVLKTFLSKQGYAIA